jgi:hypothetical protein
MPKYDQKSLTGAAQSIYRATDDASEHYYSAGGSQYGSWDASVSLPPHEKMSLLRTVYDGSEPGGTRQEIMDDFAPDSHEVFLTRDFFIEFGRVYVSAVKAVQATVEQAGYGAAGLDQMARNARYVEDANITAIFHALDKTQNRGA